MGDGWLVAFASVVDAAACAIAVQERLAGHDRIKLRIGVHLGDIVHEDEDIYGDGVNIAARLQEVAEPGGILISGTAHESLIDGWTKRSRMRESAASKIFADRFGCVFGKAERPTAVRQTNLRITKACWLRKSRPLRCCRLTICLAMRSRNISPMASLRM